MDSWDNKLTIDDIKKVMYEIEKKTPCSEKIVFDKTVNEMSKENYAIVSMMLIKLLANDYFSERLLVYNNDKHEWNRYAYQEYIPKDKLSKITYIISIKSNNFINNGIPSLCISCVKQIKSCYIHEFQYEPYTLGSYINFGLNGPTFENFESKYIIEPILENDNT
jgi:hypothetical protein